MKKEFCSFHLESFQKWLKESGEKPFRASQIFDWVYKKGASSFEEMTNLSKNLREKLSQEISFPVLKKVKEEISKDQETIKFLWELSDGMKVESVLIMSGERRTVCVSIQVGCAARCAFCASGKQGIKRNLTTAEVIEQVLQIDRFLKEKEERVSHIVFMGMGEPMDNYYTLISAIQILISEEAFHISQRRITVSTVGVIDGIRKFQKEPFRVNLVLSLHAPNQRIRQKIMPYARKNDLEELLFEMEAYASYTKRDITYEYILIAGINDQKEHAYELAELLKGKQCTVNLIPYNPVEGLLLRRPKANAVELFREVLEKNDISVTWRYTKGKDIAAACGQLALKN